MIGRANCSPNPIMLCTFIYTSKKFHNTKKTKILILRLVIYKSKLLSFFLSISLSFDYIQTYDLFVNCFELFASIILFCCDPLDF